MSVTGVKRRFRKLLAEVLVVVGMFVLSDPGDDGSLWSPGFDWDECSSHAGSWGWEA